MKTSLKKKIIVTSCVIVTILVGSEIFLRTYLGFCDTILLREDPQYEYIPIANQNKFKFRNHISYNSLSMRSPEIDTSAAIILGFGDSVINGGLTTDQDSLATTLISSSFSKNYKQKVQFLNISVGSWGPDNCFAYLKKHGNFSAKRIYLFVSSHDAYDNMTPGKKIVGRSPEFPNTQYKLALYELFDRYVLGFLKRKKAANNLGINKKTTLSHFDSGFGDFANYCKQTNIPLTIYLHAETTEVKKNQYNKQGQEIIKFANQHNIPLIKELDYGFSLEDYRDQIHLKTQGQRKIAAIIFKNRPDRL